MKLTAFTNWAERRTSHLGLASTWGRALLSTLWAMIGGPIFWVMLMPFMGGESNAVLYALAAAMLLSFAGYAATLSLIRHWKR